MGIAETRERARLLIEDGCTLAETARSVGVDAKTIGRWFPTAPRMTPAEVAEWARFCKANQHVLGSGHA